jgi:hypothetical protein
MISFDEYIGDDNPLDETPPGPLQTWAAGDGFMGISKNGRPVMSLRKQDLEGLVVARIVLAAIMNEQLNALEIEHLKAIVDAMITRHY